MTNDWIMSDGGPLIVLQDNLKKNWGGIFRLTVRNLEDRNDYDRACRVTSYLQPIPIIGGAALIVGDIPMDSCFWCSDPDCFGIAQVCFCNQGFDLDNALKKFLCSLKNLEPKQAVNFLHQGGDLVMFDSAARGDNGPDLVSSSLKTGHYLVSTYTFEPDDDTSLVIHAFQS